MAQDSKLKVLNHCRISPLAGSVESTSLPLTFLDIPWLSCSPIKHLFFYEFPHLIVDNTIHSFFSQTILPILKHSLSLALQIFFPFAGHLICPLRPNKPHLLYKDGDSVPFIVAHSGANFNAVTTDSPKDIRTLHPLVPELSKRTYNEDGTRSIPLMAIQVTLLSGGFSIGVNFRRIAADAGSFHLFMKTWSAICRNKGDLTSIEKSSLPFYDREVIKDPKKLEQHFLNQWWEQTMEGKDEDAFAVTDELEDKALEKKVRATFSLSGSQIENLKKRLSSEYEIQVKDSVKPAVMNFTNYAATCAVFWVCLVKSEANMDGEGEGEAEVPYYFYFLGDYRKRSTEGLVPQAYFGNCLAANFSSCKRAELLGESGILEAAKAIGNTVLEQNADPLREAENWVSGYEERRANGHQIALTGSPKLDAYEIDFGWGRPKKSEAVIVYIDVSEAISISGSREGAGGVEVGLALGRSRMDNFVEAFDRAVEVLSVNR